MRAYTAHARPETDTDVTAYTLDRTATYLLDQDAYPAAIGYFERSLAGFERFLGPEHPDTLITRSNLANAYQAAGRLPEALPLFETTLTDSERILGPDHPDTVAARNALRAARGDL